MLILLPTVAMEVLEADETFILQRKVVHIEGFLKEQLTQNLTLDWYQFHLLTNALMCRSLHDIAGRWFDRRRTRRTCRSDHCNIFEWLVSG